MVAAAPASVLDVAEFILEEIGPLTGWKLQKLVYYAQAWSLAWDGVPLFNERIEAWENGPVAPDLWNVHRGRYEVTKVRGSPARLSEDARATVRAVIGLYGKHEGEWLADLTHREAPWADVRGDLGPRDSCRSEITQAAMRTYYATSRQALDLPYKAFPQAYDDGLDYLVGHTFEEIAAMDEPADITTEEFIAQLEAEQGA